MSSPSQRLLEQADDDSKGSDAKPVEEVTYSAPASNGKPPEKTPKAQQYLHVPLDIPSGSSVDTPSNLSTYSADNENERRTGRSLYASADLRGASRSPAPPATWHGKRDAFWARNKGMALVFLSQLFGALMNVTTRLLETDGRHGKGMHPFQVCQGNISHKNQSMYLTHS